MLPPAQPMRASTSGNTLMATSPPIPVVPAFRPTPRACAVPQVATYVNAAAANAMLRFMFSLSPVERGRLLHSWAQGPIGEGGRRTLSCVPEEPAFQIVDPAVYGGVVAAVLFAAILGALAFGRWLGQRVL